MSKNNTEDYFNSSEEGKGQVKYILSKFEYDLYHEEDDVPSPVIQVKKIGNIKKGEKWKVLENNKLVLTIDGVKLSSKERSFLYSPQGISFLISQYKSGIVAITTLKKNMKNFIK